MRCALFITTLRVPSFLRVSLLRLCDDVQVFEGIPAPFDKKKRVVVPAALRVARLKPSRDFAHLGKLAAEVGWKHFDLIKRLEAQRKVKSDEFYAKKKEALRRLTAAKKAVSA